MNSREVILFGGGGGAIEIARYIVDSNALQESTERFVVTDLLDEGVGRLKDLERVTGNTINSHKSLSTIDNFQNKMFVNTLGLLPIRSQKYRYLKEQGANFLTVIHPTAHVSETATIEEGCIIAPFSMVGEFAKLGADIFVNVAVTIGHDVTIGESCIISPNVALCGAVNCGAAVYFGAGTTVDPTVEIGAFSKVSSGAVVKGKIEPGSIVFGNPAQSKIIFSPETGQSLFGKRN